MAAKLIDYSNFKSDEQVNNQTTVSTSFHFKLFFLLLLFHKMDTIFKFIPTNIHYRCAYLTHLEILLWKIF